MIPRISVVIANYNYGRFLGAAMESVLNQSFADLELIVVDDGSTDNSLEVIDRFAIDQRVTIVKLNHHGQCEAKNAGISRARGEWVAFLDADDIWLPSKLERQVQCVARNPGVGVVYTRRTLIDEKGFDTPLEQPAMHRGSVLSQIFRNNFVCFSSAMVRRDIFDHIGLFDPSIHLAVDYDLWLRIARHYEFDYVDEPLVKYRVGHGNLSRRVGERLKTVMLLMRRFLYTYGGHERIDPQILRLALAETYCNMGFAVRPFQRRTSAVWFCRALAKRPLDRTAWRGIAGCVVPDTVRRLLRGKEDWQLAYCTAENDPRKL